MLAITVTGVEFSSSRWSPAFVEILGDGWIPVGQNASQAQPIAFAGVDRIRVEFSELPETFSDDALQLVGLGEPYSIGEPQVDRESNTVTWRLNAPLNRDALTLRIREAAFAEGTFDGDWRNFEDQFPAGDGIAGGDFEMLLTFLPADLDRNGVVNLDDFGPFKEAFGTEELLRGDIDGSGQIDLSDFGLLKQYFGVTTDPGETVGTGWAMGKIAPDRAINLTAEVGGNVPATGALDKGDVYIFEVVANSSLQIEFETAAAASVSLRYGNDIVMATLTAAPGQKASFSASQDVPPGHYNVLITPSGTAVHSSYRLRAYVAETLPATAADLGLLTAESTLVAQDVVGGSEASDGYKFRLEDHAQVRVAVSGLEESANVKLYDGATLLGEMRPWDSIADREFLDDLPPGEYRLVVLNYAGSSSRYTLDVEWEALLAAIPGNDGTAVVALGTLTTDGKLTAQDVIGGPEPQHGYTFRLEQHAQVRVALSGLEETANVKLYHGATLLGEMRPWDSIADREFFDDLPPGEYYLAVWNYAGSSSRYTLDVEIA
jgi:hypothetical protein